MCEYIQYTSRLKLFPLAKSHIISIFSTAHTFNNEAQMNLVGVNMFNTAVQIYLFIHFT